MPWSTGPAYPTRCASPLAAAATDCDDLITAPVASREGMPHCAASTCHAACAKELLTVHIAKRSRHRT